ncbi:MAG: porin [Nitrospira sp.]|nr:porin [Nitrospira sp.]MDH4304903.1 porin [Nitrospira sp.]MDH5194953.1 porin [Nitrospira sp.]
MSKERQEVAMGQGSCTRAESLSPCKLMIVQASIIVFTTTCVLVSALGQVPGAGVHGPEPSTQQSELEALKAKVKQLEQSVEDIKKKESSSAEPLSSGTSTVVPAIDRERELVTEDAYADARLDNAPFDPALRGFFRVPGSHTMMRIGGYIRTDAIYDFRQLGNMNQFRPESIPTPNLDVSNYNMAARASRLTLESRTDTTWDVLRTYIEIDFVGPGNSTGLRLRHFYAQLRNILVGQSWTTFHDSDVIPETADFNGPNSWIFQFNPQVRYTHRLAQRHVVSVAAEQPSSGVPSLNPVSVQSVSSTSPFPDFVVRYRYETDDYHFNTAGLFRSVGGVTSSGQSDQVFGYGVMASGLVRLWGRDNIVFQAVYGEGIARYFIDPKNLNLDAGYDSSGVLKAQPAYGGYAAIQHFWNDQWRSTVTYGFLQINTTETSPGDTYKKTQYLDCNLMYSPAEGITIGGGFLWGQRVNKNDVSGDGFRINFLLKYDLVRLQQDVKKVLPF